MWRQAADAATERLSERIVASGCLVVRAMGGKLFARPQNWPVVAREPPRRLSSNKARSATLGAGTIRVCRPLHGRRGERPAELTLNMVEAVEIAPPEGQPPVHWPLFDLAAPAVDGAVKIIQLVDARDGSLRPAGDLASKTETAAATVLLPTLERKTARQQNPHPPASLAWLS